MKVDEVNRFVCVPIITTIHHPGICFQRAAITYQIERFNCSNQRIQSNVNFHLAFQSFCRCYYWFCGRSFFLVELPEHCYGCGTWLNSMDVFLSSFGSLVFWFYGMTFSQQNTNKKSCTNQPHLINICVLLHWSQLWKRNESATRAELANRFLFIFAFWADAFQIRCKYLIDYFSLCYSFASKYHTFQFIFFVFSSLFTMTKKYWWSSSNRIDSNQKSWLEIGPKDVHNDHLWWHPDGFSLLSRFDPRIVHIFLFRFLWCVLFSTKK